MENLSYLRGRVDVIADHTLPALEERVSNSAKDILALQLKASEAKGADKTRKAFRASLLAIGSSALAGLLEIIHIFRNPPTR